MLHILVGLFNVIRYLFIYLFTYRMSYPIIIIENLPHVCEKMSLKPAMMNLLEHLMDYHMPVFRLSRISENYQQLELCAPEEFISDGQS